jgi:hypothetical protein
MTRSKDSPGAGTARRALSPTPGKPKGERRNSGERRDSAENRREFARYSPTQRPSERRQSERRSSSH